MKSYVDIDLNGNKLLHLSEAGFLNNLDDLKFYHNSTDYYTIGIIDENNEGTGRGGLNIGNHGTHRQDDGETSTRSKASGLYSFVAGQGTKASGACSVAWGHGNATDGFPEASNIASTAIGIGHVLSSGLSSFAGGFNTVASGNHSFAFGTTARVSNEPSRSTQATALGSIALCHGTVASGAASFSIGVYTTASGGGSFASGIQSEASGDFSHAEGNSSKAMGVGSHAEGSRFKFENTTKILNHEARGKCSHIEGIANITEENAEGAHVEGFGNKATYNAQHLEGKICFNYTDTSYDKNIISRIGSGILNNSTPQLELEGKNLREWHKNGDYYIYGIGGFNGVNSNLTSTKSLKQVLDTFALKSEIATVYRVKGTKGTFQELQAITNPSVGDVYNIRDTGSNYVWTGAEWDKLSETIDLSGYYTKEDLNNNILPRYVTLGENQSITGIKTFKNKVIIDNSETYTPENSLTDSILDLTNTNLILSNYNFESSNISVYFELLSLNNETEPLYYGSTLALYAKGETGNQTILIGSDPSYGNFRGIGFIGGDTTSTVKYIHDDVEKYNFNDLQTVHFRKFIFSNLPSEGQIIIPKNHGCGKSVTVTLYLIHNAGTESQTKEQIIGNVQILSDGAIQIDGAFTGSETIEIDLCGDPNII